MDSSAIRRQALLDPTGRRPLLGDGDIRAQTDLGAEPMPGPEGSWYGSFSSRIQLAIGAFHDAGAGSSRTLTARANRMALEAIGAPDRVAEIAGAAVRLARQCCGPEIPVLGVMGTAGRIVALQEASPAALGDVFAEQAAALEEAGADAVFCSRFSELAEARIALEAAKRATALPVGVGLLFDAGIEFTETVMGDAAVHAVSELAEFGADWVACEADDGIDPLPVLRLLGDHTKLPIWCVVGAGKLELDEGRRVWRETPKEYADRVVALLEHGCQAILGGPGALAAHIAATKRRMEGSH